MNKTEVAAGFDGVAEHYDRLVSINPGYLKHLSLSAQRLALPTTPADGSVRILDLCCGTGLSTAALRRVYPNAEIVGLDASAEMLRVAAGRLAGDGTTFVAGDATDPRASGITGEFHGVLMAYGIRNIPQPDPCLSHIRALLAPSGRACFHEYALPDSRWQRAKWAAVSSAIIVPLSKVVAGDTTLFRYLRDSVWDFDGPGEFQSRLKRAGFGEVQMLAMTGWQRGLLHSFVAQRGAS